MKIKVIINRKARDGRNRDVEPVLREKFGGSLVGLEETAYPRHATELARQAVKDGIDTLVAVGGDGTVNEVLNGIVGTKVALGIIPAGTANDLAGYYDIPADIDSACEVILNRRISRADLIWVNGWHYATAGGVGFPLDVAKAACAIRCKSKLGRFIGQLLGSRLYILAALCALLKRKAQSNRVNIRSNGSLIEADALSLMVNNQPFLGKSFLVSPGAVNDDGMLDVCLIENSKGLVQTLLIVGNVLRGTHVHSSSVRMWRASELTVYAQEPVGFLGDGEVHQTCSEVKIEVVPSALRVITPKASGEVSENSDEVEGARMMVYQPK